MITLTAVQEIFGGDGSRELWRLINAGDHEKPEWEALYAIGCACQRLEALVRRLADNSPVATPAAQPPAALFAPRPISQESLNTPFGPADGSGDWQGFNERRRAAIAPAPAAKVCPNCDTVPGDKTCTHDAGAGPSIYGCVLCNTDRDNEVQP